MATGAGLALPYYLSMLGDAYIQAGRPDDARDVLDEGLAIAESRHVDVLEMDAASRPRASGQDVELFSRTGRSRWISSMKRIELGCFFKPVRTPFNRASKSPRNFVPANKAPISRE